MKILVTGGAGFIGGNFVHHMVNKYPDYEIVNLDLLTYAGNLETLKPVEDKPNYKFVKGDTKNFPAITSIKYCPYWFFFNGSISVNNWSFVIQ